MVSKYVSKEYRFETNYGWNNVFRPISIFSYCLGIAIMLIERYVPTNFDDCDDCRLYYNNILAWVCSGFSLAALISVISLFLCQMFFGSRKVDKTTISVDVNIDMKY